MRQLHVEKPLQTELWPFLSAAAHKQDLSQAVEYSQGETTGITREHILRFIPIILPL